MLTLKPQSEPAPKAPGRRAVTDEDDVVAHLYFVAANVDRVTVTFGRDSLPGRLDFPDMDLRLVPFAPEHADGGVTVAPSQHLTVRVTYDEGPNTYAFFTEVVARWSDGRWLLAFPRLIERSDRRIAPRHNVFGEAGYSAHVDIGRGRRVVLPIYDISVAGVGIVFDGAQVYFAQGDTPSLQLHVPGCPPLDLLAEVRNVRPLPGDWLRKVAGCSLLGVTSEQRRALASALAAARGAA
jgi:hypothetical protein